MLTEINTGRHGLNAAGRWPPCMDGGGVWMSGAGAALRGALCRGSIAGALAVLDGLGGTSMANALSEAGFGNPMGVVEADRDALLAEMQLDLTEAAALSVDGFGLSDWRREHGLGDSALSKRIMQGFAAKVQANDHLVEFNPDFAGDIEATRAIQAVLSADALDVELLGEGKPEQRATLLFIAGQALQENKQGFAFDGIAGKYAVHLSMADMVNVHHHAAKAVAEESARAALGRWADDKVTGHISDWVPDSIHNVLRGAVSVSAAQAVVSAIESGTIGKHAGEIGSHTFSRLLAEQGFDVEAPTVDRQAADQGLVISEPDKARGQYIGLVVAVDHRACLVKYSRDKAMLVVLKDLPEGVAAPKFGDSVRIKYKAGEMSVSVVDRKSKDVER